MTNAHYVNIIYDITNFFSLYLSNIIRESREKHKTINIYNLNEQTVCVCVKNLAHHTPQYEMFDYS